MLMVEAILIVGAYCGDVREILDGRSLVAVRARTLLPNRRVTLYRTEIEMTSKLTESNAYNCKLTTILL